MNDKLKKQIDERYNDPDYEYRLGQPGGLEGEGWELDSYTGWVAGIGSCPNKIYRRKIKPVVKEEIYLPLEWDLVNHPSVKVINRDNECDQNIAISALAHYKNGIEYRLEWFEFASVRRFDRPCFNGHKATHAIFTRAKND